MNQTFISRRLTLAFGAGFATLLSVITPAGAGTSTDNLEVTATVVANCTISADSVPFGNYDPIVTNASSPLAGTGTITVTCTNGSAATITLDQGANPDVSSTDTAPLRQMTDGTSFLGYALYSDASHTTVWGNDATVDVDHTGSGSATNLTVYGQVAGGQNVPAGSYTDTVVATVTF